MKYFLKSILLSAIILVSASYTVVQAQSLKIFGGDVVNGAFTGAALGGATMALRNSPDFGPARIGLGVGILSGTAVGIYDNIAIPKGGTFYKSGVFNSGTNSSILVLLDTFYGAATGAVLGSAVSLISHAPITKGLQYGSGAGAWVGAGLGMLDSFVLAKGPASLNETAMATHTPAHADGLIRYASAGNRWQIGMIHPTLVSKKIATSKTISLHTTWEIQLVSMNVNL